MARSDPFHFDRMSGNMPWLGRVAVTGALGNILLIKAMSVPGVSSGVVLAVSGSSCAMVQGTGRMTFT